MFRKLSPEKVYVTDDVYKDQRAVACVERIMKAVKGAKLERVTYEQLDRIATKRWQNVRRWGAIKESKRRDPDLVLTMAKFWSKRKEEAFKRKYPNLGNRDMWGFLTRSHRIDGEPEWRQRTRGCICQSAIELKSAVGCPFRCAYCGLGGLIRLFVNMEEYVEHLDEILAINPKQRLYKWDNITDVSCFEPEWGASRLLVEYFAKQKDKYLEIYVGKSDNVDDLLTLDNRGKTIMQWSISAKTQSTKIEPESAPWKKRVDAARKCQEAGYIVRFRFSPIVPVKNWKRENANLIKYIFENTSPDVISLCSFGWMSYDDVLDCIDMSLVDEDFAQAMKSAAPFINERGFTGGGGRPIPHDARASMFKFLIDEIRQYNKTIPVSLCLETVEMWALFGEELGMPVNPLKTANYYCNCGPLCTPEHAFSKGVKPGPSWFEPDSWKIKEKKSRKKRLHATGLST